MGAGDKTALFSLSAPFSRLQHAVDGKSARMQHLIDAHIRTGNCDGDAEVARVLN